MQTDKKKMLQHLALFISKYAVRIVVLQLSF